MLSLKQRDNSRIVSKLFFSSAIIMLLAQYYLIFDAVHARKIFYAAGYVSIILALVFHRQIQRPLHNKSPAIALLMLALAFISWTLIFKHDGAFNDIYISYYTSGKILLMLAILLFIFANFHIASHPVLLDTLFIVGGIMANIYAIYQYEYLRFTRIELSFDRATMAAYIITVLDILMLHAVLNRHGWKRYILFILAFSLSFSTIVFSGTRAAILAYPILCLLLAFTHREVNRYQLIKIIGCLLTLFIVLAVIFKQPLAQRVNEFTKDVSTFRENNSQTSVGSRIAMLETGLRAGRMALLGQSADTRGTEIVKMVNNNPSLAGAEDYANVHMHNELIENFSLRGIIGVITLLAVYASLIWCAWQNRNSALFVITLSLITYGLSDVIFFSREGVLTYAIAILTAIVFLNNPVSPERQ